MSTKTGRKFFLEAFVHRKLKKKKKVDPFSLVSFEHHLNLSFLLNHLAVRCSDNSYSEEVTKAFHETSDLVVFQDVQKYAYAILVYFEPRDVHLCIMRKIKTYSTC